MTLVLARRGAHHDHRENTIEAFRRALELGAAGVELDVRTTADGVLVVHHDADVPGAGAIDQALADDLPPYVPTLLAVLDECRGSVVNIEVKANDERDGAATAARVATLLGTRTGGDRVVVSSFSPAALDAVVAAGGIETAWLLPALPEAATVAVDPLEAVVNLGYRGIHPVGDSVTPALVARAHERGLAVRAWTINDPGRARELANFGTDAVITDEVAAVRAALA